MDREIRCASGGVVVPAEAAAGDGIPLWLDNSYVIPASMTQPFTFDDSPGDGELRAVTLAPVDEHEDDW